MKTFKRPAAIAAIALIFASVCAAQAKYTLSFSDEFNGPRGQLPDTAKWTAEIGGEGWGNRELQYYTASAENASLDGKGRLVIRAAKADPAAALKCWYGPCRFTSARLISKGKFEQLYGRFEARIKLPRGQGIWPAFWMLGNDIDVVGWPKSGEIDVMENVGKEPATVHGTIHGPGYSGDKGIGAPYKLPDGRKFADRFHKFSVDWTEKKLEFRVDGRRYKTLTPDDLPEGEKWVFDHPFFILLNVAVGGNWPGEPDQSTVFPQEMLIDYVRVYRMR